MSRFILRFTGSGKMPASDLQRIRSHPEVKIVDETSRMLLIEATKQTAGRLGEELAEWVCTAERSYPVPDPRPKIRS